MTFLLLSIQSVVCVACVAAAKKTRVISFRDIDIKDVKAWYPISCLLVSVIYTGSKSLVCTADTRTAFPDRILTAISQYTRLHHIQESDDYSYCAFIILCRNLLRLMENRHMEKSFGSMGELRDLRWLLSFSW